MRENILTMSDAEFEKWRYVQDEYADIVAAELLNSPVAMKAYEVMGKIQKNNDPVNMSITGFARLEDIPDEDTRKLAKGLGDYFNNQEFFNFSDAEKIILKNASEFYTTHMVEATLSLALRSLLKQYAAYKATNVLKFTQLLPKYPHRRILSTFQFVLDVMDPKAYDDDGYGIRAIQKLRLVHAMIRCRLKQGMYEVDKFGPWNDDWGLPINQQDMIFAVHTFSVEVLDGMIASGEIVSNQEIANYYYAWHIIGKALGVKDELNPIDYATGKQLQERIYKNQFVNPNENGPILAEPLIEFMDQILPMSSTREIYSMIKIFNDEKDYDPIFKDILKIDLDQANDIFGALYKTSDDLRSLLHRIEYWLLPKPKKQSYADIVAYRQHNLFEAIVSVEKTWTGEHFRITDGFGMAAAKEDELKSEERPPLYVRMLNKILPNSAVSSIVNIVHQIASFFKKK